MGQLDVSTLEKRLESLKVASLTWQSLPDPADRRGPEVRPRCTVGVFRACQKAVQVRVGFQHDNKANRAFSNYGDRYRRGERIPTSFAESTDNQVISKRIVKK